MQPIICTQCNNPIEPGYTVVEHEHPLSVCYRCYYGITRPPSHRYTVSYLAPHHDPEMIGTYPDKTRATQAVQRHATSQRVEHGELVIITTSPGYYIIQPEGA